MLSRLATSSRSRAARTVGLASAAAVAASILLLGAAAPAGADDTTPTSTPANAVLWGMDDNSGFDATEAAMGRNFSIVREYRRLDQVFVSDRMQSLVDGGRSMMVSVRARDLSDYISYDAITAGRYDDEFVAGLGSLNALATPTYFAFQHEADSTAAKESCSKPTDAVCGREFVDAWRHVHHLAVEHGFTNIIFTWTVTSYGFNPQTNVRNNKYWPGVNYTDWIGVDAYNGGCNGSWWGSFEELLDYTVRWVQDHAPDKPIILPEYAATEGSSAHAKAHFFNNIPETLEKPGYANIKAILYWNNTESGCDFRIDSSDAAYDAFRALGKDRMMSARAGDRLVIAPTRRPAAHNSAAAVKLELKAVSKKKNKVKLKALMPRKQHGAKVKFFRIKNNGDRVVYGKVKANKRGNAYLKRKYKRASGKTFKYVSVAYPKTRKHHKTHSHKVKARIH